MIHRWVPGGLYALGTDGYGRSDKHATLRRHFEVDAEHICLAALGQLAQRGQVAHDDARRALEELGLDPAKPDPLYA
jgi:pyruvate dehydrogenase E1 component